MQGTAALRGSAEKLFRRESWLAPPSRRKPQAPADLEPGRTVHQISQSRAVGISFRSDPDAISQAAELVERRSGAVRRSLGPPVLGPARGPGRPGPIAIRRRDGPIPRAHSRDGQARDRQGRRGLDPRRGIGLDAPGRLQRPVDASMRNRLVTPGGPRGDPHRRPSAGATARLDPIEVGHDPPNGPLGVPYPMRHWSKAHLGFFHAVERREGMAQEHRLGTVCPLPSHPGSS